MELITKEKKGFKKTEVGWIPMDWNIELLVNLSTITRLAGAEYSSVWEEDKFGEIIALRGFNIGQNQIIERDFVRISDSLSKQLKRSRLKKGDIVYPCVGSIGNATVIHESDKYHIQQNIARIIPTKKIDSTYIAYYLMSPIGLNEIDRFNATSSQPNVLVGSLRQYRVPLPPTLEEQQAIATALSDVDELIRSLDRLIEKKEAIKKGTMQQLLTGNKRLPGFDGKWEKRLLPEVFNYIHGKAHEKHIDNNGNFIVVNSKFISTEGSVVKRSFKNFCSAKKGDILTVLSDLPNGRALAKCFLVQEDNLYAVNQRICILRPKEGDSYFLHYLMNRHWYFLKFDDGVTQTHILNRHIENCPLFLPKDIKEQKAIGSIIYDMDQELQTLRQKREKMRRVKEGMMQELLTGKTRLI